MKGFFDSARKEGFPTMFPEDKTAVTADVLETGFIVAFVMLVLCFYLVIPGFRGNYQIFLFVRVTVSLLIGAILMTSNFGQVWEVGSINSQTAYKAGMPNEINATIGVKIGLRSVNVTLLETNKEHSKLPGEKIDYNERFWWTWDQGRFGFGPFGKSAFPCWLIANFMFSSVIRYGAYFTLLTGVFQLLACLLWAVIRNSNELVIPFEHGNLTTKFGPNFWVTLVSGIVCTILGFVIVFLDLRHPDNIALFFGVDPLADYEEYHLTSTELEVLRPKDRAQENDMVEMNLPNSPSETTEALTQCVLKRRTTVKRAQKSLYRTPAPRVRVTHSEEDDDDETPIYYNVPRRGYAETIPEETTNSRNDLYNV
ncbi:hypothetical protein C0J52_05203 [Blattella germanica]|nr:hypothetical protein C0J52_05203 [Blattella germanica]